MTRVPLIIVLSLALSPFARAGDDFPVDVGDPAGPRLQSLAFLETVFQRHDNIFLSPVRQGDRILSWRPGAAVSGRATELTGFKTAATADVQRFHRHDELDQTGHRVVLSGETGDEFFFARAGADDRITRDRAFTTLTDLLRRRDRMFTAAGGLTREGDEASVTVERFSRDFEARLDAFDRTSWTARPFVQTTRGPWAWNLRLEWTRHDYPGGPARDGFAAGCRAGLDWKPDARWESWAGVGAKRRRFDGPALTEFSGSTADGGAKFKIGGRVDASIEASTDEEESVVEPGSGYYRDGRTALSGVYRAGPKLSFETHQRFNRQTYARPAPDAGTGGRRRDRVRSSSFRTTYQIFENLALWAEGDWERRASNRASQRYRAAVFTGGLRMEIRTCKKKL